jgi:hypothetical protein
LAEHPEPVSLNKFLLHQGKTEGLDVSSARPDSLVDWKEVAAITGARLIVLAADLMNFDAALRDYSHGPVSVAQCSPLLNELSRNSLHAIIRTRFHVWFYLLQSDMQ